MPTYEYRCNACGHEFEQFQSITADAIRKCPQCGKLKVQRLLSGGAGVIFKGSGFYTTDYRSDAYKSDAKADSGGGGSSDAKPAAEAKPAAGDSKPAAKSDASKSESPKAPATPPAKPSSKKES